MIYLDNASTTPIDPRVVDAMLPYMREYFGNPNSPHAVGKGAAEAVERAREQVAALIGAEPKQISFAHSATDAAHMVFGCYSWGSPVVSAVEHSSVLDAAYEESDDSFYTVQPDRNGIITPEAFRARVDELFNGRCQIDRMASVMLVNNETGAVNDVEELAKIAGAYRMWFHTDATAAAGAMRIDAKDLGVDFMTFAAHKMHGPKGVAAIYSRQPECGLAFDHAGGTPDVPAIVGFGEACRIQKEIMDTRKGWTDADYNGLSASFLSFLESETGWFRLNRPCLARNHFDRILSVYFAGIDAEMLVQLCSDRGLMISAGAACKSHEQKPSHVLKALGMTDEEARSTVRISFSRMNTAEECVEGAKILAGCVNDLRKINHAE